MLENKRGWVIVEGRALHVVNIYGVFDTNETAHNWADRHIDGSYEVEPITVVDPAMEEEPQKQIYAFTQHRTYEVEAFSEQEARKIMDNGQGSLIDTDTVLEDVYDA